MSSVLYAQHAKTTITAKRTVIAKLEGEARTLRSDQEDVDRLLTQKSEPKTLESALTNMLVILMRERNEDGISLATVLPAQTGPGNATLPMSALAEPVGVSNLKSARINVRGGYQSYDGLKEYLHALRTLPIALVYLKVEGNTFEMGLRAYGT